MVENKVFYINSYDLYENSNGESKVVDVVPNKQEPRKILFSDHFIANGQDEQ